LKWFWAFDAKIQSEEHVSLLRNCDWYPLLDNSSTSETTKKINNHNQTIAEEQSAVFEAHNTFVSIRMWDCVT
jgi:hypothetical protein